MIRLILLLILTIQCTWAEAQFFRRYRGSGYSFNSATGSYNYKGKTYTLGVHGPVCSNPNCAMCRRLAAALRSEARVYRTSPVPAIVGGESAVERPVAAVNDSWSQSVLIKPIEIPFEQIPVEVTTAFDPTPDQYVDLMLDIAGVGKDDIVYDPGCGDGRILKAAVGRGAMAVGIEINPDTYEKAKQNLTGLSRAAVHLGDSTKLTLQEATVVTLYLYPDVMQKLVPKFLRMNPGTKVISYLHDIPGLPTEKLTVDGQDFYIWTNGQTWRQFAINPEN